MGRLARDKELRELRNGEEIVVKTGLKNNIIKFNMDITSKGFVLIETSSEYIDVDGQKKYRATMIDLKTLDLILEHDISIGYDNTKDTEVNGLTKGYFIAFYNGKKQKLHRMIYKYFNENMSIEDIFNNAPSECDGKEIHHIDGVSWNNQCENLKLMPSVQEHSNYHKNISTHICLDQKTNKYTIKENFRNYIWCLKNLNKELKGELPKDNEDYQTFYNELEEYAKINEDILYQPGEINIHFNK